MPNVERAGRVDPRCISCDSLCLAKDQTHKGQPPQRGRRGVGSVVRCPKLLSCACLHYSFASLRAHGQGVEQSGEASSKISLIQPWAIHCIPHTRPARPAQQPSARRVDRIVGAFLHPAAVRPCLLRCCALSACTLEMKPCGKSWATSHCMSPHALPIGPRPTIQPGSYRPRVPLSRLHMRPRCARLAS